MNKKSGKFPKSVGIRDVKNQKTLEQYIKRLIWVVKQCENN